MLALGQVSGPFLQAPSQGQELWCPGEQQELLPLTKLLPKLGLGLVALVESLVVLELAESLGVLELAEFLGPSVELVASVA